MSKAQFQQMKSAEAVHCHMESDLTRELQPCSANTDLITDHKRGQLRRISCHGRNYSQPYFFKRNQSSDNRSHGFGAKFLLKKLSASDFSYERKSAFRHVLKDKEQS